MTLTASRVREVLDYDPRTGVFTWLVDVARNVKTGTVAGSIYKNGYRYITIEGRAYKAHRLAWLWMLGVWPEYDLDHNDTDKTNNAWANLREATRSENEANKPSKNPLGKGVRQRGKRYFAQIRVNGRKVHLGTYDSPTEAHAAYAKAANNVFGEFARVG